MIHKKPEAIPVPGFFYVSGLMPPPVIQRRFPEGLLKNTVKMAAVGKAQLCNDFRNAHIRVQKQSFRLLQINSLPEFQNGFSGIFFYNTV